LQFAYDGRMARRDIVPLTDVARQIEE